MIGPESYEPEVLEIGRALTIRARAGRIVAQALADTGSRDDARSRAALRAVLDGYELLGYGEIANRLGAARRALREIGRH